MEISQTAQKRKLGDGKKIIITIFLLLFIVFFLSPFLHTLDLPDIGRKNFNV